jgi:four helix bundle protein
VVSDQWLVGTVRPRRLFVGWKAVRVCESDFTAKSREAFFLSAKYILCNCCEMEIRHFRDLVAWQRAFEFCVRIHLLTRQFPPCELYGLTSQLRRAAISIPSNIAEGCARMTTGEFIQHLGHARGSLAEGETEMLCAIRFGYVAEK